MPSSVAGGTPGSGSGHYVLLQYVSLSGVRQAMEELERAGVTGSEELAKRLRKRAVRDIGRLRVRISELMWCLGLGWAMRGWMLLTCWVYRTVLYYTTRARNPPPPSLL